MDSENERLAQALREGNARYEARFGRVFLIRAKGRSGEEMLQALTRRLQHTADEEVAEALAQPARDYDVKTGRSDWRMSTLSTHILDISTGTPAEGVTVSLSREGETLANLVTNAQGRIATFSAAPLPAGRYCLTAETGAWFARAGRESVFTRAQIDFVIGEAAEDHFHLPFLIAPGGWSTYRGS